MRSQILRGFVPGPLGRPACFACRAQWRRQLLLASPSPSSSSSFFSTSTAHWQRSRSTQLPDTPARTRFAPSPTGYLHLGSLRTALYNYLLARATKGQFLLRIEDTDQSRLVADAEQRLYDDLRWAGLHWDEGPDCGGPYGPYRQSERLPLYREHAERLLAEGKAFRCFCSHDDLDAHQRQALQGQVEEGSGGGHTTYPGRCLAIPAAEAEQRAAAGETHTVRFRGDRWKDVTVADLVYGRGRKPAANQPDDHFILIKSDGFPTYHFANVVDDHHMRITHVIRGAEWLVSTPKHARLYAALGWTPPVFAHVGLLVDAARQKLSKRNMDTSFAAYQALNVQPAALLNFAALLGWHPQQGGGGGRAKEVMTLDEMVERFTPKFTRGDIVVDTEKLAYFRRQHLRRAIEEGPAPAAHDADDFVGAHVVGPMLAAIRAQQAEVEPGRRCVLRWAEEDEAAMRRRLRDLLRISRSTAIDPEDLVRDNALVVWSPAPAQLARAWDALTRGVLADGRIVVAGLDAPLAAVVDHLGRHLVSVPPQQWTEAGIKAVLDKVAGSVSLHRANASNDDDGDDPKPLPSGATIVYKLLRWALLASEDGPQMVPLMRFLGQEVTLKRLAIARERIALHTAKKQ